MSQHTIKRIANVLEKQFENLIDMSDYVDRPPEQRRIAFLQRALAAQCIKSLASVSVETAGRSVTDGFHDCGIDAVHFDQRSDTLFIAQSKWNDDGNIPINGNASGIFVDGVRDLLAPRLDRFNEKIKAKEAEIKTALYSERDVKVVLVVAHTATQPIAIYAKRKIDDYVEELNNPVPIARAEHLNQAGVYRLITSDSEPPKISIPITLREWGAIDKPFMAYYGRVHILDVAKWWREYEHSLSYRNLRHFFQFQDSAVNDALRRTLTEAPQNFWYFNNGVTIICDTVSKSLAGAPGRELGLFHCEGVSVVNGAQTVGMIGTAASTEDPANLSRPYDDLAQSWVQVRIISLENCPPGFDRDITRATNFQNSVSKRDFAAMDPVQHRLATDFALDGRKYVYKSGETDPGAYEGCSISEATQALACAHSAELAVQVKREIGELWINTDTAPYIDLFNDALTSTKVWKAVQIMRAVDEELQKQRKSTYPRADMVGVHLHRIILHLAFRDPGMRAWGSDESDESVLVERARVATRAIFPKVATYIEDMHQGEYLASLCKNRSKCTELVDGLDRPRPSLGQKSLFEEPT